jgi:hypothetical protein
MELAPSLREHLRELEDRFLRPDVRRSRQVLDELLSDEFIEFASDGVAYDKGGASRGSAGRRLIGTSCIR